MTPRLAPQWSYGIIVDTGASGLVQTAFWEIVVPCDRTLNSGGLVDACGHYFGKAPSQSIPQGWSDVQVPVQKLICCVLNARNGQVDENHQSTWTCTPILERVRF
jgi:hypothetical protein